MNYRKNTDYIQREKDDVEFLEYDFFLFDDWGKCFLCFY